MYHSLLMGKRSRGSSLNNKRSQHGRTQEPDLENFDKDGQGDLKVKDSVKVKTSGQRPQTTFGHSIATMTSRALELVPGLRPPFSRGGVPPSW